MGPIEEFQRRNAELIEKGAADESLQRLTRQWFDLANTYEYSYHYAWMSRPIIQYPQDIVAMQEIIWQVKPDLIIETGIAHGGSLIMSASMLALLDYCEAVEKGTVLDPKASRRRVIGIDIDIRQHNRQAMEAHPMAHRIDMIQGSSVDPAIVRQVHDMAKGYERVLVCLDSNHTHDHVLQELEAYAPLASMDSYCVVFDTVVEDLPDAASVNRPWGKGNNPKTAVYEYLRRLDLGKEMGKDGAPLAFEIDKGVENKLLITVAPDGFLKRIAR
ncbi:cephalosporin hydroxylase family protein [Cupriavidus consociatus]|uniref:cephalosporin hydroxylase family protein n=1 Tax=Cupriavidus consociatus TaxID=2821357 RepID=UPI001AE70B35|nr:MULTISPECIES: cephalosporin hydroxylase family protein [unclassified Cupriavidus]MBP0621447.1 cephalosporin hydroxylase family protein [Cupriavidus sp. LEh25]MDK2658120.1 cephalosporin hydroxylase family protein [Cupriavidus sp. LEh21]